MQGGKAPNAQQKRWQDWLRDQGCACCGAPTAIHPTAIHHCVGSTARHRKVWIGQDWVIPLCYDCHQAPHGIHGDRRMFIEPRLFGSRKKIEKTIFLRLVATYRRQHGEYPMPTNVIAAIEGYHR